MAKPQRGRSRQPHPQPAPGLPAEFGGALSGLPEKNMTASRSGSPQRRATYPEAVARYEHGMKALQEHRFAEAAESFRAVLTQYPEEKELNDRVRLYLTLCERQLKGSNTEPTTREERLYAATLALNARDVDAALRHLGAVVSEDPEHDGALYMLGVVHALREDTETALSYLRRAIERNPENRLLALQDADLERLLQDESNRAALEAAAGPPSDNRRTPHFRGRGSGIRGQ